MIRGAVVLREGGGGVVVVVVVVVEPWNKISTCIKASRAVFVVRMSNTIVPSLLQVSVAMQTRKTLQSQ